MIFTLEALHAHKGDALLLHYGDDDRRRLIVIDGGPNHTWERLRDRLEELRESRAPDGDLPIRLVMVSHVDDDHIHGILEMTQALLDTHAERRPRYEVSGFWHNGFDDVVGRAASASTASVATLQGASAEEKAAQLPVARETGLVLQSIKQGRRLRDRIAALGLEGNAPFGGLVTVESPENPVAMGGGLTFTVVGPAQARVDELEAEWDEQLRKAQARGASPQDMEAIAAAYLDRSAANLSSIVVLAEADGRRMLLTGDARGDFVLEQLEAQGLTDDDGRMHVDLLKLPHHGSIRNLEGDFFERIVADHYVISADGEHGNPDLETLRLLTDVRGGDEYTIHLTNRVPHAVDFFEEDQGRPDRRYAVVYRDDDSPSVRVELGDPLPD